MAIWTFTQPDSSSQTGSAYKTNIDTGIAVLATLAQQFAAHAKASPDLTVLVDAGTLWASNSIVSQNQQTVSGFVATASTSRIDRVVGDLLTGVATRVAGAESASPVPPAIPIGKFPIAQVGPFSTSTTAIPNTMITNERVLLMPPNGKRTLWVPSGAQLARTTGGPSGPTQIETATNKVNVRTWDFAQAVQSFTQLHFRAPKSWDLGTFTATPHWIANSASGNSVVWGFSAVVLRDGVALDQARGTAQEVTKANGGTNVLNVGPESAAITPAGTPQARDWILLEVYRKGSGGDTLAATASLIGVEIVYNSNGASDD